MIVPTGRENLWIVPANLDLAGVEVELIRAGDHLTRLRRAFESLRAEAPFDYVLLDCPPSLGVLMTNALSAADEIMIPLQCEYYSMEGLAKIIGVCEQLREAGANPDLQLSGIVMTMYLRTNHANQVIAEIQKLEATRIQLPTDVVADDRPTFWIVLCLVGVSGAALAHWTLRH